MNQNVINSIKATLDTKIMKSYFYSINRKETLNLDFIYRQRSMKIVSGKNQTNKQDFTVLALTAKTNIKITNVVRTQKKKKNPGRYF